MARYRTLKPEFFTDERLAQLPRDVRYLFAGLWPFVDDMGRARFSPHQIKAQVFPDDEDIDADTVERWLRQLQAAGIIECYSNHKRQFFRIPSFTRHQYVNRPTHSSTPKSPSEVGPACNCADCRKKRNTGNKDENSGGDSVSESQSHGYTHGVSEAFTESRSYSQSDSRSDSVCKEVSKEVSTDLYKGEGGVGETTVDNLTVENQKQPQNLPLESQMPDTEIRKERQTRQAEAEEIAGKILSKLGVTDDPSTVSATAEAVWRTARADGMTYIAAGNRLMQRMALALKEENPANWPEWLARAA